MRLHRHMRRALCTLHWQGFALAGVDHPLRYGSFLAWMFVSVVWYSLHAFYVAQCIGSQAPSRQGRTAGTCQAGPQASSLCDLPCPQASATHSFGDVGTLPPGYKPANSSQHRQTLHQSLSTFPTSTPTSPQCIHSGYPFARQADRAALLSFATDTSRLLRPLQLLHAPAGPAVVFGRDHEWRKNRLAGKRSYQPLG